ncbi:hypothetical protein [Nocardia sp. NPDC003963]
MAARARRQRSEARQAVSPLFGGLITGKSGDVWFSLWQYEGDEQLITPGMPVTWQIGEGSHGKYAKASEVRPVRP